jgi:phage-related protein
MSLGTLYVKLNSDAKEFASGFAKAATAVKEFSSKVKEVAEPMAGAAAAVTAMAGASVALAASVDSRAARSLKGLTDSTTLLAVQVSDVLEPAVRRLADVFRSAAGWVAGLDPELKRQIATWALWVVGIGTAAKTVAILADVLASLAGIAAGVATGLAAVGIGPIAAVAALLGVVVLLHRAWRTNLGGIQDATREFALWMTDVFTSLATSLRGVFSDILDGTFALIDSVLQALQMTEKISGRKLFGGGTNVDVLQALRSQWKDTMQGGGGITAKALEFAKNVATSTGQTFTEELKIIKDEVMGALGLGGKGLASKTPRAPGKDSGLIDMGALYDKEIQILEDEMKRVDRYATLWNEVQNAEDARLKEQLDDLSRLHDAERQANEDARRAISERKKMFAQQVLGGLGALGQTISSIAEGAKAGGIWGAIAAAFLEVAKRMDGFQRLMGFFELGLKRLGEFLGPILGWIFDFIATQTAVGTEMIGKIISAIAPIFEGISELVNSTGPILGLISKLVELLAPILNALAKGIGAILKALGPVIKVIWEVVKYIVVALGGVLGAVIQVINWVEQFIGWLLDLFGNKKAAAEMRANMTDMDAYWKSLSDLANSTWDQQAATDAATTGAWDAAAANTALAASTAAVTEQLLNVPAGYKIAYARYSAMFAAGEGPGGMAPAPSAPPGSKTEGGYTPIPAQESKTAPGNVNSGWSKWKPAGNVWPSGLVSDGPSVTIQGNVNITSDAVDAESFAQKIVRSNAVRNAQATGSWYAKRGG